MSANLDTILDLLGGLERVLHAETEALISGDTTALNGAVAVKREALRSLSQVMAQSGIVAGSTRGQHDIGGLPRYPEFIARLERCRALNDAAGGAIASQQQGIQDALGLLGIASETPVYGQSGSNTQEPSQRALAIC